MPSLEEILKSKINARGGPSKAAIAGELSVSEKTIENYMNGKRRPKHDTLLKLSKLLHFSLSDLDDDSEQNVPELNVAEPGESYLQSRLKKKNGYKNVMVPLVPVKAQAGYVRAVDQSRFIETMEEYALPPGVNPIGAVWRYWEVEGESMEPAFHSGDFILTSQVHTMDWENLRNFYLYVVVTNGKVLFKRVYAKSAIEWVLISENEERYPQQLISVLDIQEVWVFRRHIVNHAPPSKRFEIKV